MRKSILALLIVCSMLMPFATVVNGAGDVEVTSIVFTDADKSTEVTTLNDFADGVGCSFTYSADGSRKAYGMLLLKRNGRIIDYIDQEFSLKDGGILSFDHVFIPEMIEAGRYTVSFYLCESKDNMALIKGGNAEISGDVFPDDYIVTSTVGLDFEDEASVKRIMFYKANGTADATAISQSFDYARHGDASLAVTLEKAWDRLFTATALNTGVMAQKERALGDGTYRVSGYVYPSSEDISFSPRIVAKNTALNGAADYNYTKTITAPAGKWTYFSAEYNVEGYFSESASLVHGRPQIQVEKALKGPQIVYFDDIALTKIDYDAPEMTAQTDIIVKVATQGSVVVKAENSDGILYALETVEADENGVAEAAISLADGSDIGDTTVAVYTAEDEYLAKASDALEADGVKYMDFRYFSSPALNGVKVLRAAINGDIKPYDEITLEGGAINIDLTVSSEQSKKLKLLALKFTDGVFKEIVASDVKTVSGTNDLEAMFDSVGTDDVIEFFVTDENNTLLSRVYTLDKNGFKEKEMSAKAPAFSGEPTAQYDPVNMCTVFNSETDNEASVLLVVRPADANSLEDSAYIGVVDLDAGSNSSDLAFDTDKFNKSGEFVVDYYTVSSAVRGSTEPFPFISKEELQSYFDKLNAIGVTEEDVESVINTKSVGINLNDYNLLNDKDASSALKLFIEYNENRDIDSAMDIQELLDKSCATVMFCTGISAEAAERLGEKIMPDSEYFKEFTQESGSFKALVAELIGKNKISSDKADTDKAEEIFKDAFVTAQLIGNAQTYGAFMEMATETYADEINLDMSGDKKLSKSDIFKYMFTNRKKATSIDGINKLYKEAVSYVNNSGNTSGSGGGSGSSSGKSGSSSSGGGVAYTNKEPVEEVKPARVLFLDMEDTHWALDSVLFLNSIGVIADAPAYRPNDSVLREEIVKMLVCAFGELDDEATSEFKDVPEDVWSYPYIASAFKIGFINGVSEDTFGAGNAVSRQDCAVMIYRIVKDKLDIPLDNYELQFSDNSDISDYAVEAVKVLAYNGIINGYEDGSFKPFSAVSRAESAKLITSIFRR